jgi:predicted transcriptional regulator
MASVTKQHTVRVSESTHRALRRLTAVSGKSMTIVLERAVDRYEREQLFAEANAAWAAIQADPAAMAEIEAEQELWDRTLADGLEDDEW